jgi:hypothetical protein
VDLQDVTILAIRVEMDMHNPEQAGPGDMLAAFHSVKFAIPHDHPLTQAIADYNNERLRAEYIKYLAATALPDDGHERGPI